MNVQLLGISSSLPFSQKAFADSLQLPYPLLSDMKLNVTKSYGVMYGTTGAKIDYPDLVGREIAGRSFFLVDKDGIVRGKWVGEDLSVFSTEVFLKAAQEIAGKPAEGAGEKKPPAM